MLSEETGVDAATLKKHPMHHVLTNVVGARHELDVTVHELDLEDGQTLMMCTDGLHGVLRTKRSRTLQEEPDARRPNGSSRRRWTCTDATKGRCSLVISRTRKRSAMTLSRGGS
jgi:hypothetical protein